MAPLLISIDGVRIEIYSRDHLPVHIHARYAEDEALVHIRTSEVIKGSLPPKKLKIVQDWLAEEGRRECVEQNFYELNPRLAPKIETPDLTDEQEEKR